VALEKPGFFSLGQMAADDRRPGVYVSAHLADLDRCRVPQRPDRGGPRRLVA